MTDQAKLDAAKAAAKEKVGEKQTVTPDTINFQKGSDSKVVYTVLEKAKKPLTLKEIEDRAIKAEIKNPKRAVLVANWFVTNGIAEKNDKGGITLVEKTAVAVEKAA